MKPWEENHNISQLELYFYVDAQRHDEDAPNYYFILHSCLRIYCSCDSVSIIALVHRTPILTIFHQPTLYIRYMYPDKMLTRHFLTPGLRDRMRANTNASIKDVFTQLNAKLRESTELQGLNFFPNIVEQVCELSDYRYFCLGSGRGGVWSGN